VYMSQEYVYRVKEVVKVTDGDTYWFQVDVGFRQTMLVNVRLNNYDTPEKYRGSDFEKSMAASATDEAVNFFDNSERLWVQTEKDPDSFGRWLGTVWSENSSGDRTYLGEVLQNKNLASTWPTRWREEFDSSL
jgi:endonuclease YncB( thermonuclease family)